MKKFSVKPKPISSNDLFIGEKKESNEWVYLGRLAETGPLTKVKLNVSNPRVMAIFGKRGSGKSFTLGSILEGLCSSESPNSISCIKKTQSTILFDILGIFQWFDISVNEKSNKEIHKQQSSLKRGWDIKDEKLNVEIWQPRGEKTLRNNILEFKLNYTDFTDSDWGFLFNVDLMQDRMGQLLTESFSKIVKEGWFDGHKKYPPNEHYSLNDLIECINNDIEIVNNYKDETRRALLLSLKTYLRSPLFVGNYLEKNHISKNFLDKLNRNQHSIAGISLSELISPGKLSILLLHKINDDLRNTLIVSLIRKIIQARVNASEIEKSKEIIENFEIQCVTNNNLIPPVWIAIDEVQNFLPSERKTTATDILVKLVREGRNYGVSFIFTTQQPTAIDPRILAQVDTMIVHKLSVQNDIEYIKKNIKSNLPVEVKFANNILQFDDLLRNLDTGQALISDVETERAFIIDIRPRISIHGNLVYNG